MKAQNPSVKDASVHGSPALRRHDGTTATVLFVDDETSLLDGLRNALRRVPFAILTAASAAEGIEVLGRMGVDVVVSDERMPGMRGSEFVGVVRERWPETMRIMLTGQASLDAAIRAINQGDIYRFLTKPCNPTHLVQTIRDALLFKNLIRESARLLAIQRHQRAQLDQLERDYPGIARVQRTADGWIVLAAVDADPAALIEEIRSELGEGETSRLTRLRPKPALG